MNEIIDNQEILKTLIKETNRNIPTFTKTGSNDYILKQQFIFNKFNELGYNIPKLISSTGTSITMEFINGISVFQALQILAQKKKEKLIFQILDELCHGIENFQEKFIPIKYKLIPYDVKNKVNEIAWMLLEFDKKTAQKIFELIPSITDYYKNSNIPFRDANPKNYILRNVLKEKILYMKKLDKNLIFYIDFTTIMYSTFRVDDFCSILFHYMINEDIRTELLKKYRIQLDTKENIMTAFVRFGRFWARRQYYKKYSPKLFAKRYQNEDLKFYHNIMNNYTEKVISILDTKNN